MAVGFGFRNATSCSRTMSVFFEKPSTFSGRKLIQALATSGVACCNKGACSWLAQACDCFSAVMTKTVVSLLSVVQVQDSLRGVRQHIGPL